MEACLQLQPEFCSREKLRMYFNSTCLQCQAMQPDNQKAIGLLRKISDAGTNFVSYILRVLQLPDIIQSVSSLYNHQSNEQAEVYI